MLKFISCLIFLVSLVTTARCDECTCNDDSLANRIKELEAVTNALVATVERQDSLIKQLLDERGTFESDRRASVNEYRVPVDDRKMSPDDRSTLPDRTPQIGDERSAEIVPSKRLVLSGDGETIAFTAYVDHDIGHMGDNQVIPYNNVITNIGGSFNVHTHTFNCPTSGIYLFTFVVSELGQGELVAKLVVNGNNVVDAIANPVTSDHDQQGSNTAIIQVNQGQSVWVANYVRKDVSLRSDDYARFASFSGFLLQALS